MRQQAVCSKCIHRSPVDAPREQCEEALIRGLLLPPLERGEAICERTVEHIADGLKAGGLYKADTEVRPCGDKRPLECTVEASDLHGTVLADGLHVERAVTAEERTCAIT